MQSDYNEISNDQLEESLIRLSTYEKMLEIQTAMEKNQKPEYLLLSYMNTLENNKIDDDTDILIVIEHNTEKILN